MPICEPKLPHLSPPPTWSTPLEIIGLIGMEEITLSNKFNKYCIGCSMLAPESIFWICLGKCAHWLLEIQDSRNRLSGGVPNELISDSDSSPICKAIDE